MFVTAISVELICNGRDEMINVKNQTLGIELKYNLYQSQGVDMHHRIKHIPSRILNETYLWFLFMDDRKCVEIHSIYCDHNNHC